MWGTDGAKVFTLDDGWVWVFSAIEHWNAECMGWHVTKRGDRYAALEPMSQGLTSLYDSLAADVARGLQLRMDHGSHSTRRTTSSTRCGFGASSRALPS